MMNKLFPPDQNFPLARRKRLKELAERFARGELPEQTHAPLHRWCGCRKRNKGKSPAPKPQCKDCGGTGILPHPPSAA